MELNELREMLAKIENGAANAETAVSDLITAYKIAGSHITAAEELQKQIKLLLSEIMAETLKTDWKTDAGRAYVPAAGVSVRYDTKKLDMLCQSDSQLAEKLRPFRIESERPGTLTIR